MNRYILSLGGYPAEEADAIRQNIRFWCLEYTELYDGLVSIATDYSLVFLVSKGIPKECLRAAD